MVNSYFDFEDYQNPVHTYLDDRFIIDLVPGLEKDDIIYIKKSEAEMQEMQDSIWHYSTNSDHTDFISEIYYLIFL